MHAWYLKKKSVRASSIFRRNTKIQFLPLRLFRVTLCNYSLYLKNITQTVRNVHLPSNINNILDKSDHNKGKNIKGWRISQWWLVTMNLTSCKIISNSHDGDSHNFRKNWFQPIRYFYESTSRTKLMEPINGDFFLSRMCNISEYLYDQVLGIVWVVLKTHVWQEMPELTGPPSPGTMAKSISLFLPASRSVAEIPR